MRRILGVGCLAFVALIAFSVSTTMAEEPAPRIVQEAISLFRAVLPDEDRAKFDQCAIRKNESTYTVPSQYAREHLNANVHADLAALHYGRSLSDIIDPSGAMVQAFCNQDEISQLERSRLDNDTTGRPISLSIRQYSFPVFDESFETAAIVAQYETIYTARPGQWRPLMEGHGRILVFKKKPEGWVKTVDEVLYWVN